MSTTDFSDQVGPVVKVEIVDFRSEHADAFRRMNLDWITRYWEIEDADRLYLDRPFSRIGSSTPVARFSWLCGWRFLVP